MTIDPLREIHQARPFTPFRVHLADGRTFDVEHPELLWHTPNGRTVIIAKADEMFEIVDLLLVTSLERIDGRTGRRRRRR